MCVFCYLGQKLTNSAAEINDAICDTEWYKYRPKIQILLVPIIMRTQKPFVMTGYSLVSASLVSFKEVSEIHYFSLILKIIFEKFSISKLKINLLNQ